MANKINRRDFLRLGKFAAAALAVGTLLPIIRKVRAEQGANREVRRDGMLYRKLGRTGEEISAIGLGGYHIGLLADEKESIRLIRTAVDRGISFLDNCWDYHDGRSELWMGKALRDGYRKKVFLMSKIDGQTGKAATRQLDESLKRFQTDRIDLMQFHEVIRFEDPSRIFAKGGAADALMNARKAGKIRYIGFTGHKDPEIHLKMLAAAEERGFVFDSVQMPLNVMDAHFKSFEKRVLPVLLKKEIGVLGMKSLGSGHILNAKAVSAVECLHYALNLPTSTVITGIDSFKILEQALEAVRTFKPLSEKAVKALLARTEALAKGGKFELFKTSSTFDGTEQNPEWLGLAG